MERVKRELLNRMGIDVWQLRQSSAPVLRESPVHVTAQIPAQKEQVAQKPLSAEIEAKKVTSLPVQLTSKSPQTPSPVVTPKKEGTVEDWHFEVLYLVCGRFSMIIDREDYRGVNRRLADDLLRMLGEPKVKPQPVSFRWPQLNAGSRESALSAWRAFIEKKEEKKEEQKLETASDHKPQLFVVESELCHQLSESIPLKFHWIPKLDLLLGNGQGKRELWQVLKSPN
jgi:hypothetical protein